MYDAAVTNKVRPTRPSYAYVHVILTRHTFFSPSAPKARQWLAKSPGDSADVGEAGRYPSYFCSLPAGNAVMEVLREDLCIDPENVRASSSLLASTA